MLLFNIQLPIMRFVQIIWNIGFPGIVTFLTWWWWTNFTPINIIAKFHTSFMRRTTFRDIITLLDRNSLTFFFFDRLASALRDRMTFSDSKVFAQLLWDLLADYIGYILDSENKCSFFMAFAIQILCNYYTG